ncbi:hypothetical protein A4X06_0g9244, partial [Tilletia controversa]
MCTRSGLVLLGVEASSLRSAIRITLIRAKRPSNTRPFTLSHSRPFIIAKPNPSKNQQPPSLTSASMSSLAT